MIVVICNGLQWVWSLCNRIHFGCGCGYSLWVWLIILLMGFRIDNRVGEGLETPWHDIGTANE